MKRMLSYLRGWRGVTLIVYTWLVVMSWAILYIDVTSPEVRKRFYLVSVMEAALIAVIYLCPRLLAWAEGVSLGEGKAEGGIRYFVRTWLKIFGIFFVLYVVFYPGGFSVDNTQQYSQALGIDPYNDWHPVLHTLFAFKLPLMLTGGWPGSVNLFQVIIFSLSLAYTACVLRKYAGAKYTRFFMLHIMLNPATLTLSILPVKDTYFSILAMLLTVFAVQVYYTKGGWLKCLCHNIAFILVITLCTIFRHNAILFTLPMWFAVSLFIKKRHALMILVCFLGLVYLVRYPLYNKLRVIRPDMSALILGVPMSAIGNAVVNSPEKLDADILEFAYAVAPKEMWHERYTVTTGFGSVLLSGLRYGLVENEKDSVRYKKTFSTDPIKRAGWLKVLEMTFRCFRQDFWDSLRGFVGPTSIAYGIFGPPMGGFAPVIMPNKLGLKSNEFFRLDFIEKLINKIIGMSGGNAKEYRFAMSGTFTLQSLLILADFAAILLFKYIFWCIGLVNLVLIIFVLARLKFNTLDGWKRLCFILPLFIHNYGTMLLILTTDYRYFYCSYLVLPLMLAILLKDNNG